LGLGRFSVPEIKKSAGRSVPIFFPAKKIGRSVRIPQQSDAERAFNKLARAFADGDAQAIPGWWRANDAQRCDGSRWPSGRWFKAARSCGAPHFDDRAASAELFGCCRAN